MPRSPGQGKDFLVPRQQGVGIHRSVRNGDLDLGLLGRAGVAHLQRGDDLPGVVLDGHTVADVAVAHGGDQRAQCAVGILLFLRLGIAAA